MLPRLTVLDAPSTLGLAPPAPGEPPGCADLPAALRAQQLLTRLGSRAADASRAGDTAQDAGAVPAPPYRDYQWRPGDGVRHAAEIAGYSRQLADRLDALLAQGTFPLVLGGDCSILIGVMLALRRRGRYGLACLDGPDFRHPDNTAHVGGAAGESLALVTGRGDPALSDLEGRGPYLREQDAVVLGMRAGDEFADEVRQTFTTIDAAQIMTAGGQAAARQALPRLTEGTTGFWVHLDADVLDPSVMPAVDTPEPGGLDHPQLAALLSGLLGSPACVGLDLTIYDPHRDPQQVAGAALVDTLVAAVSAAREIR